MAAEEAGKADSSSSPSEVDTKPDLVYMFGGYAAVIISGAIAVWWASKHNLTMETSEGFAPFAIIYVVAQALERGLQPFTFLVGKAKEKSEVKQDLTAAKREQAHDKVAEKQKRLGVIQADRAILFWAIATCPALLICGVLDLGLIQSIAHVSNGSNEVPHWFDRVDVVITGVAIGSGTKPLHDVLAFVQNAKQKSEPVESASRS
jgi:hypothetical protein